MKFVFQRGSFIKPIQHINCELNEISSIIPGSDSPSFFQETTFRHKVISEKTENIPFVSNNIIKINNNSSTNQA